VLVVPCGRLAFLVQTMTSNMDYLLSPKEDSCEAVLLNFVLL
jgi:hypothetical protein